MPFLIEIDIEPVLAQIGPFALRWYSLMIMVGVIAGTWLAARLAAQRGIDPDDVYSAALWVVVAGIVGARLFHVLDHADYYLANPAKIVAVYEGGLAIWGGILGGSIAAWAYARSRHFSFWRFADAASFGAILGQAIGRIGNLINGDVAGKPTGSGWGVVYTNPHVLLPKPEYFNTPTMPYAIYEMTWDLAVFGLLFLVARRARFDGEVLLAYSLLYATGRFVLSLTRDEDRFLFGLPQSQVLAIGVIVLTVYFYLYLRGGRGRAGTGRRRTRATPAGT